MKASRFIRTLAIFAATVVLVHVPPASAQQQQQELSQLQSLLGGLGSSGFGLGSLGSLGSGLNFSSLFESPIQTMNV